MTAHRLLRPVLAALLLATGNRGFAEESPTYELREAGVPVRVSGIDADSWDGLRELLRDQLSLGSGDGGARPPLADDLAFFTRQHLLREGWPEATVR